MNPIRASILFFAAVCVALVGVIAFELQDFKSISEPAVSRKPAAASAVPSETASTFRLKSVAAYNAVSQRPLFFKSRRPVDTASATGENSPATALKNIGLTGVIITPDKKTALVYSSKSPNLLSLEEGQSIEGWRLEKVLHDRILLSDGDKTAEIIIWDKSRPRPPRPKARSQGKPPKKRGSSPTKPAGK